MKCIKILSLIARKEQVAVLEKLIKLLRKDYAAGAFRLSAWWWATTTWRTAACSSRTTHAPSRRTPPRAGGLGLLGARESVGRENFDRSLSFYSVALPGYLVYKATDLRTRNFPQEERDKRFDALHEEWAPAALKKIVELRGFYVKIGQMAATNIGNAFPPPVAAAVARQIFAALSVKRIFKVA